MFPVTCIILSYIHRIIRFLHLRGGERGRSHRGRAIFVGVRSVERPLPPPSSFALHLMLSFAHTSSSPCRQICYRFRYSNGRLRVHQLQPPALRGSRHSVSPNRPVLQCLIIAMSWPRRRYSALVSAPPQTPLAGPPFFAPPVPVEPFLLPPSSFPGICAHRPWSQDEAFIIGALIVSTASSPQPVRGSLFPSQTARLLPLYRKKPGPHCRKSRSLCPPVAQGW